MDCSQMRSAIVGSGATHMAQTPKCRRRFEENTPDDSAGGSKPNQAKRHCHPERASASSGCAASLSSSRDASSCGDGAPAGARPLQEEEPAPDARGAGRPAGAKSPEDDAALSWAASGCWSRHGALARAASALPWAASGCRCRHGALAKAASTRPSVDMGGQGVGAAFALSPARGATELGSAKAASAAAGATAA